MMRTIKRSLIVSSLFVVLPLSSSLVFAQTPPAAAPAAAPPAAAPRRPPRRRSRSRRRPPPRRCAGAAPEKKRGAGPGLSLAPDTPQAGGRVTSPAEPPPVVAPEPSAEWKFEVTGYFRAPMRMSWGPAVTQETNTMGQPIDSGTQLRTPPMVPDANYIDWRYTNSLVAPWTELNFKYGNDRVKAQVQIASYNLTDPGYRRLESNLGINQAFIQLLWPELGGSENLHLSLIVGGFTNRYGAAGRYDAGKYETYLFGRTHVAGADRQRRLRRQRRLDRSRSRLAAARSWSPSPTTARPAAPATYAPACRCGSRTPGRGRRSRDSCCTRTWARCGRSS